jgi:hypothetical protein
VGRDGLRDLTKPKLRQQLAKRRPAV